MNKRRFSMPGGAHHIQIGVNGSSGPASRDGDFTGET